MCKFNEYAVQQRYGRAPKREQAVGYLKALKVIIGADGEIAEEEKNAFMRLMERMGAATDIVEEIEEFDFTTATLETVLPSMKPGGLRARMLLRDAVQIVRADGVYAVEEQAAVQRAAELLGLKTAFVSSIEALVELEEAVAKLTKSLL